MSVRVSAVLAACTAAPGRPRGPSASVICVSHTVAADTSRDRASRRARESRAMQPAAEALRQERRARLLETRAQIQALRNELGVERGALPGAAAPSPGRREADRQAPSPPAEAKPPSQSALRRVRPAAPSSSSASQSPPPSSPAAPRRLPLSVSPASEKCAPVDASLDDAPHRLTRCPAPVDASLDEVPLQFPSSETVAHIIALKCELGVSPGKLVRPTPVSGSPRPASSASAAASHESRTRCGGNTVSPAGSPVAEPHCLSAWQTQSARKEPSVQQPSGAGGPFRGAAKSFCEPTRIAFI